MKEIINFNKPLITPIDEQFYEDINKNEVRSLEMVNIQDQYILVRLNY